MESLRTNTIRNTESPGSMVSCSNEEIMKKKEDELLYGAGEDGDEEDALSDDSLRLRLSDDEEMEVDEGTTSRRDNKEQNNEQDSDTTIASTMEFSSSCNLENGIAEDDDSGSTIINQEEHEPGNVSVDENIMNERRNNKNMSKSGSVKSKVVEEPPWPEYVPRYRNFLPYNRSFCHTNRILRNHYMRYKEHYNHYKFHSFLHRHGSRDTSNHSYMKRFSGNRGRNASVLKILHLADSTNSTKPTNCVKLNSVSSNDAHTSEIPNSKDSQLISLVTTNESEENKDPDKKNSIECLTNCTESINSINNLEETDSNVSSHLEEKSDLGVADNKKDDSQLSTTETDNTNNDIEIEYRKDKSLIDTEPLPTPDSNICNGNVEINTENIVEEGKEKLLKNEEDIPNTAENNITISNVVVPSSNPGCSIISDTIKKENHTEEDEDIKEVENNTPIVNSNECDLEVIDIKEEISLGEDTETLSNKTEVSEVTEVIESNDTKTVEHGSDPSLKESDVQVDENTKIDTSTGNTKDDTSTDNTKDDTSTGEKKQDSEKHSEENNTVHNKQNDVIDNDIQEVENDVKNTEENSTPVPSEIEICKISKDRDSNETLKEKENQEPVGQETKEKDLERDDNEIYIDNPKCNSDVVASSKDTNCISTDNNATAISDVEEIAVLNTECEKDITDKINTSSMSISEKSVHKEGTCTDEITIEDKDDVSTALQPIEKRSEQVKNTVTRKESIASQPATQSVGNLGKSNQEINKRCPSLEVENASKVEVNLLNSDVAITDTSSNADAKDVQKRKRRRKRTRLQDLISIEDDKLGNGRQKRKTARNAEEIIRKNLDSDTESSDTSEKYVILNRKTNQDAQCLSPPSLKRNCSDSEAAPVNGSIKKLKTSDTVTNNETPNDSNTKDIRNLSYIHKFFQRDMKDKLPKLTQQELEELLIQKIVETITMRSEIGRLREQARITDKNLEATRSRCQQLAKQVKDFEMVLSKNAADRRANNDKPTAPIKINRSVGLQVNYLSDQGMQNLRQLQQNTAKPTNVPNGVGSSVNDQSNNNTNNNSQSPRRGIKVRSPRRSETPVASPSQVTVTQSPIQTTAHASTVSPAALVVTKSLESQHILPMSNQVTTQAQMPNQTIVLNGKLPAQINRQNTPVAKPTKTNDLIDLTDEEEKNKTNIQIAPAPAVPPSEPQVSITQQKAQPCYQRVIQAIPGNVAIANQSIRVVQPSSQPTPTALVNNMSAPTRLAYVMQSGIGNARQVLITSNSNPIRPVTSCNRPPFTTVTYKTSGISTIANGTVRVLTTQASPTVQIPKHPAPLPDTPNYVNQPAAKLPPPAPSLKISKVTNGIVLSWNMALSDKYADIVSYQLYAYQEVNGVPPHTNLWKKVGDVRALPLPMACTLTQFSEGNNYYFAVRAVDSHSRKGQYSTPGNISL